MYFLLFNCLAISFLVPCCVVAGIPDVIVTRDVTTNVTSEDVTIDPEDDESGEDGESDDDSDIRVSPPPCLTARKRAVSIGSITATITTILINNNIIPVLVALLRRPQDLKCRRPGVTCRPPDDHDVGAVAVTVVTARGIRLPARQTKTIPITA